MSIFVFTQDVLHPNRPNVSKDELRDKLADLYKATKTKSPSSASVRSMVVARALVSLSSMTPMRL